MRTYHVAAGILVFIIVIAITQIIFSPIKGDADTEAATSNVLNLHTVGTYKSMKSQRMHDMQTVFAGGQ